MPHRKRILLSDDNEGFRTLLLESLHERGGFHVFHAREEHEVMETIQCHKPHILLLDDMLPHKGGLHVLRQLRERGHRLSTILMTVLPTQKIVRDATELGASYVFPKPFSSQVMIEKIQELLKLCSTDKALTRSKRDEMKKARAANKSGKIGKTLRMKSIYEIKDIL